MKQIREINEKINLVRNECTVYIYDAKIDILNKNYVTAKISLNTAESRINRYKNANLHRYETMPEVQKYFLERLKILNHITTKIQKLRHQIGEKEVHEKEVPPRSEYML